MSDLAKGVKVYIPTRKTSKGMKGLWEITETLRIDGYTLPYLTLDVVAQWDEFPGEVQVNFEEYTLLSRFRPEDFDLYPEPVAQPAMKVGETRPHNGGTITCYNANKPGEPERLRYYAKHGPDGRPSWPDRATEQEAEADLQEYAEGRAVKYSQEAVVPFNPEWQKGRLSQIQERLAKATPGPWVSHWETDRVLGSGPDYNEDVVISSTASSLTGVDQMVIGMLWYDGPNAAVKKEDAAFIANAPQDINFLLHEVTRARTTEATLRRELEERIEATEQVWLEVELSLRQCFAEYADEIEAVTDNPHLREILARMHQHAGRISVFAERALKPKPERKLCPSSKAALVGQEGGEQG